MLFINVIDMNVCQNIKYNVLLEQINVEKLI